MSPRTPLPSLLNTAATRADVRRRRVAGHELADQMLRDERADVRMLEHVAQREAQVGVGRAGPPGATAPFSSVFAPVSCFGRDGTIGSPK